MNLDMKVIKILYHWFLLLDQFRWWNTFYYIPAVRGRSECDFSILGRYIRLPSLHMCVCVQNNDCRLRYRVGEIGKWLVWAMCTSTYMCSLSILYHFLVCFPFCSFALSLSQFFCSRIFSLTLACTHTPHARVLLCLLLKNVRRCFWWLLPMAVFPCFLLCTAEVTRNECSHTEWQRCIVRGGECKRVHSW